MMLGALPAIRKPEGALKAGARGRFRFYVLCGACTSMTDPARTKGVAAKPWNEAKPAK